MTGTPRALPPHAFRKLLPGSWLELVAVQHLAGGRGLNVGHVGHVVMAGTLIARKLAGARM